MSSKTGVITSPNYPLNYPADSRCEWTIEVNLHHSITLTLEEIEMESYYSCEMDYLEAYEGANSDSDRPADEEKLLFKVCGLESVENSSQTEWVTTTNAAVLRFESDDSIQAKGFKLSYKEVNKLTFALFNNTYTHVLTCQIIYLCKFIHRTVASIFKLLTMILAI